MSRKSLQISLIGAVLSAFSVMIGAFGSHGLSAILRENGRVATFETAMDYMFIQSIGLLLIGAIYSIIAHQKPQMKAKQTTIAALMLAGILLFSGTLIILSITNISWLGAITPIGGVAFVAGWLVFASDLYAAQK